MISSDQPSEDRICLLAWLTTGVAEWEWALAQLPPERLTATPPRHLSEWSALRHLLHLANYERTVALPSLLYLLTGDVAPLRRAQQGADDSYTGREEAAGLLSDLGRVKEQERRLLEEASGSCGPRPVSIPTTAPPSAPAGCYKRAISTPWST